MGARLACLPPPLLLLLQPRKQYISWKPNIGLAYRLAFFLSFVFSFLHRHGRGRAALAVCETPVTHSLIHSFILFLFYILILFFFASSNTQKQTVREKKKEEKKRYTAVFTRFTLWSMQSMSLSLSLSLSLSWSYGGNIHLFLIVFFCVFQLFYYRPRNRPLPLGYPCSLRNYYLSWHVLSSSFLIAHCCHHHHHHHRHHHAFSSFSSSPRVCQLHLV